MAVGCSSPGGLRAGRGPGWLEGRRQGGCRSGGRLLLHLLVEIRPGPGLVTKFLGERQGAAVSSAPKLELTSAAPNSPL